MTDESGTFRLVWGEVTQTSIGFGTVTGLSDDMTKSVSVTPLLSLTSDDAFALESGSGQSYTIKFTRVSPKITDDAGTATELWSNRHWYDVFTAAVDRWQAKTNGAMLYYTAPNSGINPHIANISARGFVKSLTRRYSAGWPQKIEGTLVFDVGTMRILNNNGVPIPSGFSSGTFTPTSVSKADFSILISNKTGEAWYSLMSNTDDPDSGVDCVDSYTLSGGASQPFEYLSMKVPKKRLTAVAPDLVDNIVAGRNKIQVRAVGISSMTVVKCKLSNDTYTITAYCDAEVLRGKTLASKATNYPFEWIREILTGGRYGVVFTDKHDTVGGVDIYTGTSFIYSLQSSIGTSDSDMITFDAGTNIWYILQVCAMYLRCKIFFAENKAYLADCTVPISGCDKAVNNSVVPASYRYGAISLYDTSASSPMNARLVGSVSLGNEGMDTVINAQEIYCSDTIDTIQNNKSTVWTDQDSIDVFGEHDGDTLYIPELVQNDAYRQADIFTGALMLYRKEPQQSIEFTVREMDADNVWRSCFAVSSCVSSIYDEADDLTITNKSEIYSNDPDVWVNYPPQKLILSNFERNYPKCTTTYKFGVISNIDLSSSTSKILSSLSGVH